MEKNLRDLSSQDGDDILGKILLIKEFRKSWYCSWCLMNGKYTSMILPGILGPRTACYRCGHYYSKVGTFPPDVYQEFKAIEK
jgi:hypothetical protein